MAFFDNIKSQLGSIVSGANPPQPPNLAQLMSGGATTQQQPSLFDTNIFAQGDNNTAHYKAGTNQTPIPMSYFQSGGYDRDMKQYGYAAGPGFIFNPTLQTYAGPQFQPHPDGDYSGEGLYQQDDTGKYIGYSPTEQARQNTIYNAYQSMLNGSPSTTDFSQFGHHPDMLGSDVMQGLASIGAWSPQGGDPNGRNIEARIGQDGNIVVSDPRGGDGSNPMYIYGSDGKFLQQQVGSKAMSPIQGIASVAAAAAGFGAIGSATGAGGLGFGDAAGGLSGSAGGDLIGGAAGDTLGGAEGLVGVPPPANPFNFSSFLDPQNLLNLAGSNPFQALRGVSTLAQLLGGSGGQQQQQQSGGNGPGGNMAGLTDILGNLGGNLGGLANLVPGLVSANQQGQAGSQMIDWLKGQQGKIDNLYNPGTPEYNSLYDEMSRKDAAAGRNSQYGPRSVDLAGKLAGIKGGLTTQFTTGTSRALSDALTQRANRFDGLLGGLGTLNPNGAAGGLAGLIKQLSGGGSGGIDDLLNGISNNGFNSLNPSGSFAPNSSQSDSFFGQNFDFGGAGGASNFFGLGSKAAPDIFSNSLTGTDLASDVFDWFL